MKKKRRTWVYAGAVVVFVAVLLVFIANREHPDYVRAAKLLPQARKEARAAFGALTWEEWRTENGINGEADFDAWDALAESIPQTVVAFTSYDPGTPPQEVYNAEKEWFDSLEPWVDPLVIRHVIGEDGTEWDIDNFRAPREISKAIYVGLRGAADAGDSDAVLRLGRISNKLIAEMQVEPSVIHTLVATALRNIFDDALLEAAARNHGDRDVVQSVTTVFSERVPLTPVHEVMAADVRLTQVYLDHLNSISTDRIDDWLNEYSSENFVDGMKGSGGRTVFDLLEGMTGQEPQFKRKTGKRTVQALEARFWEVEVMQADLVERAMNGDSKAEKELAALRSRYTDGYDRSYELADMSLMAPTLIDALRRTLLHDLTMRSALSLIQRCPEYDALPNALPEDLVFEDLLAKGPIIYRKTPTGFVIYSRYENGIDDGFKPNDPDQLRMIMNFSYSNSQEDVGLIVSYDPITPIP